MVAGRRPRMLSLFEHNYGGILLTINRKVRLLRLVCWWLQSDSSTVVASNRSWTETTSGTSVRFTALATE